MQLVKAEEIASPQPQFPQLLPYLQVLLMFQLRQDLFSANLNISLSLWHMLHQIKVKRMWSLGKSSTLSYFHIRVYSFVGTIWLSCESFRYACNTVTGREKNLTSKQLVKILSGSFINIFSKLISSSIIILDIFSIFNFQTKDTHVEVWQCEGSIYERN